MLLLAVTLLTRGIVFISYAPAGVNDDDQAVQYYMVDQLEHGNFLIGNLRYNTGYALAMAPLAFLTKPLGTLQARVVVLVQTILSGLIPFIIYDLLRKRRPPREAFIVALVTALDPLGLEWAHIFLPIWLVAFCIVCALWLISHAFAATRYHGLWIAAAGISLAVATLARTENALLTATIGLSCLFIAAPLRRRIQAFFILGVTTAGILAVYFVLIYFPSTQTLSLSCITGSDFLFNDLGKGLSLTAANGPATAQYLNLLALKPLRELNYAGPTCYILWQKPGPWVTPSETAEFFNQPYGAPGTSVNVSTPSVLWYYMGPCATDMLLRSVHLEAVRAQPLSYAGSTALEFVQLLIQKPAQLAGGRIYDNLYLPRYSALQLSPGGNPFGFARATTADGFYASPTIVWLPGVWLYSTLFDPWNVFKILAPLGLIWAFWMRDWFYRTSAILIVVFLSAVALLNVAQPRIYAPIYPLIDIVIGGMIALTITKLRDRWAAHNGSVASPTDK